MTTTPLKHRVTEALFSPFIRVAGVQSLLLGLAFMGLTALLAAPQGVHFDGVLDMHLGQRMPWWVAMAECMINWLSLAVLLLISGKLISRTQFRMIDLIGTQALARWPMLLVSLICLAPGFHRFSDALMKAVMQMAKKPGQLVLPPLGPDTFVFGIVTLLMIACTVWMVALMWKSFAHCCHVRGGKAVTAFVVSLLLAEVVSKVLIVKMLVPLMR